MRIARPFATLLAFAACADPEDPDAGPFDVVFADSGFDGGVRPDAAPDSGPSDSGEPDATPSDAGSFTLALTASSTIVTDTNAISLTAIPMGETSTAVHFYEGTTLLGSATAAPFTFDLAFDSGGNGLHTFHAEASANGGRAISNDVVVSVAIERNLWVDPLAGLDTNPGTQLEPFKTIAHAASVAQPGETILLASGAYDDTNQGNGFGQGCPQVTFTASVSIRAVTTGTVRIIGSTGCGFLFRGSGDVDGLHFESWETALNFTSGQNLVSETTFEDCSTGVFANDTSRVRLEAPTIATPYFGGFRASAFGVAIAVVEESAALTVVGGTFEGLPTFGTGMFLARNDGRLVIEGATIQNNGRRAMRIDDNARVVLRNTVINNSSAAGLGVEQSSISMGGSGGATIRGCSLELENTQLLNSAGNGIAAIYYSNQPSHVSISLTDSRIQDSNGTGILIDGGFTADPALNVEVRLVNSVILGGTRGIYGLLANVDIQGGEVSGATGHGIEIGNAALPHRLTVRGATFDGNGGNAIHITDLVTTVDLGTTLDPGGNTMSAIPTGAAAVAFTQALSGDAVGNTWMANEQGADATGHYPAGTTATGPANGRNYNLAAGATLVIEP